MVLCLVSLFCLCSFLFVWYVLYLNVFKNYQKKKRLRKSQFYLQTSDLSLLKLCVKKTKNMGRGVFCTSAIEKGDFVMVYVGERLNQKEAKQRYNEIGDTCIIYLYIYYFIYFLYHIGYIFWFKNDGK